MKNGEIFARVDHTLLKATATIGEIFALCEEAIKFSTASVCVPPYYIKAVREKYPLLNICTVIGFPLGYSTTAAKVAETAEAVRDGANEIDMVINICAVKNNDYTAVEHDIAAVRAACAGKILKVIVEACYLNDEKKIRLCEIVTRCRADFIKTSTGFGSGGATIADVDLFRSHIGENVAVKAAGGIRTRDDMEEFITHGCDRIGTSSAVKVLG